MGLEDQNQEIGIAETFKSAAAKTLKIFGLPVLVGFTEAALGKNPNLAFGILFVIYFGLAVKTWQGKWGRK